MTDAYDESLAAQYDRHSFVWRLYIPLLRQLLCARSPSSLLDLGCGTGSLVLELCDAWNQAVGVDLSSAMIATAQHKARSESVAAVRFEVQDIRTYTPNATFDIVTCTDGVLPYLNDEHELDSVLRKLSQAMSSDGCAVLEFWTHAANPVPAKGNASVPDDLRNVPNELHENEFIRESTVVPEHGFVRHRFYLPNRPYTYTVMRHGDNEGLHRHRYYEPHTEIVPLLRRRGLSIDAEYGVCSPGGIPELTDYSVGSPIWAVVVRKEALR